MISGARESQRMTEILCDRKDKELRRMTTIHWKIVVSNLLNDLDAKLTGSRVYGKYEDDESGFDLVCLKKDNTHKALKSVGFIQDGYRYPVTWDDHSCVMFRWFDVRVYVCRTKEDYENWLVADDECMEKAPVTRQEAIKIHKLAGVSLFR